MIVIGRACKWAFSGAGNILFLDLGGILMDIFTLQYSLSYTLRIYTFFLNVWYTIIKMFILKKSPH